jgi:hypothetical protein
MLQLTPKSVIFVATIAIDFRKGIDGLISVCRGSKRKPQIFPKIFIMNLVILCYLDIFVLEYLWVDSN